jgi:regulator of sigma E protease
VSVSPVFIEEIQQYQIGIIFEQVSTHYGFFQSIAFGVRRTWDIIVLMITMLMQMIFKGQGVESVTGPVGIFKEIGKAVDQGIEYVLNLTIIITLNLGIINLLPIPALDGGRIVFLAVEAIKGSPLNREREGMVNFIGFALLMLLMLIITYRDIINLF